MPVLLGAFAIFGVFFGVFVYFVPVSVKVSVAWVVVAGGIPLAGLAAALEAIRWLIQESFRVAPTAISCHEAAGKDLLLFRPSEALGVGMAVSIYYRENGFEILIGEGEVENITTKDRLVQILVLSRVEGTEDKWKGVSERKSDALSATFAKPGHQRRRADNGRR